MISPKQNQKSHAKPQSSESEDELSTRVADAEPTRPHSGTGKLMSHTRVREPEKLKRARNGKREGA